MPRANHVKELAIKLELRRTEAERRVHDAALAFDVASRELEVARAALASTRDALDLAQSMLPAKRKRGGKKAAPAAGGLLADAPKEPQ